MKLSVQGLGKKIGDTEVLQNINFAWQPGEILGLVGRNGAGKTTLMRTMMNQFQADHGKVTIDGQDLHSQPQLRTNLIYVDPAAVFFKRYTLKSIRDYYALVYPNFDASRFNQMAADYDLTQNRQYRELSKGYQALVIMILTVSSNAPFMLLDEPFDGLDLFIKEAIVDLVISEVAAGKRGFLIASHNLVELDGLADRILFLKRHTISHDYALESLRETAVKLQLVFRQKTMPDIVHQKGQVLAVRGRVVEVLFKDYTSEIEAQLKALDPVLMETLPLSLPDIFRSEFDRTERSVQHD